MPKTLADYTPAERVDLVGMWCEVATERYLAVLVRTYNPDLDYAIMYCPTILDEYSASLGTITPRFDLPRAWNAFGLPVNGKWQTAEYLDESHGMRDVYYFDSEAPTHRYWESAWEPIPEEGTNANT